MRSLWLGGVMLLGLSGLAHAADPDRARRVVLMVYDIGLYTAELDRVMGGADAGQAPPGGAPRARNRAATRTAMMGQREAVLNATALKVAARATDPELTALMDMATQPTASAAPSRAVEQAVAIIKTAFQEALQDQLTRASRGTAEFPCTKEQRGRCS